MNKGIILDIIKLDNGIYSTFFKTIKLGYAIDNQGYGKYITFLIGLYKLEFSLSLTWRTKLNGNEENKKKNKQESKAPIASA